MKREKNDRRIQQAVPMNYVSAPVPETFDLLALIRNAQSIEETVEVSSVEQNDFAIAATALVSPVKLRRPPFTFRTRKWDNVSLTIDWPTVWNQVYNEINQENYVF